MIYPIATGVYAGLGAVACAGLAVGAYAYASMWPDSRLFGKALIAPARPGELALTFDDGPNAVWTPRLLDVLAKYDVRATFFLLGGRAERAAGTGAEDRGCGAPGRESLVGPSQHGAEQHRIDS